MVVRVIFFGNSTSAFSARYFTAILDAPCDLVGVVDVPAAKQNTTNPLAAGLLNFVEEAHKLDIPAFQPTDPNTAMFEAKLDELNPDLFIAAGYSIILKERLLSVPIRLAVNFHASLLPDYRGKHPVFWALRNSEKWSGLTVHVMDPGIDTGDIIYQVNIRTRQDDNVETLYERIIDQTVHLVGDIISAAEIDQIPRQPQPKNAGSYFSSTQETDFQIDWRWPASKIQRYITITPGKCFNVICGEKVFFFNARKETGFTTSPPGALQSVGRTRAAVSVQQGIVSSSLVKTEDGQSESFAAFCRRHGLVPGDTLTT